jgi:hypothetical protein
MFASSACAVQILTPAFRRMLLASRGHPHFRHGRRSDTDSGLAFGAQTPMRAVNAACGPRNRANAEALQAVYTTSAPISPGGADSEQVGADTFEHAGVGRLMNGARSCRREVA